MKRRIAAVVMMLMMLALTGCGSDGSTTVIVTSPTIATQIISTQSIDGDIAPAITPQIVQGGTSVSAGIDPLTLAEYRAFLHFPLGGAGGVPPNATIVSATLRIFINDIRPSVGTIPFFIDLISFPPPTLIVSDFSRASLRTISTSIFQSDFGNYVDIDVTPLMQEAQLLPALPDFQIRIREDLISVGPGLIDGIITIDDTTVARAPRLSVTYF